MWRFEEKHSCLVTLKNTLKSLLCLIKCVALLHLNYAKYLSILRTVFPVLSASFSDQAQPLIRTVLGMMGKCFFFLSFLVYVCIFSLLVRRIRNS